MIDRYAGRQLCSVLRNCGLIGVSVLTRLAMLGEEGAVMTTLDVAKKKSGPSAAQQAAVELCGWRGDSGYR